MATKDLWKTPAPSSGCEGVFFKVFPKRVCSLSFKYENSEGLPQSCELRFIDVAAFKCTFLMSLTVEMIKSSYDTLIEVEASQWLDDATAVAKRGGLQSELRHLRICFDDGPCYEVLCSSFEIGRPL